MARDRIYPALRTNPHLPLLEDGTLEKAFDMAGISQLKSYKVWYPDCLVPQRISGAELGFGISGHWRDIYECENEEQVLTRKQTLAISFTNISLTVSNTAVVGPYRFEEFEGSVYRELGFQQWTNSPSDATFLGQNQGCHQKRECARGATKSVGFAWRSCFLLEIPRATCGSIDIFHLYEKWRSVERDPLYLAAHAAAKLAKVWQGSTFGCQEPYYYHLDERPEDDGEGVTLREMFESRFLPGQTCRIGECHFK